MSNLNKCVGFGLNICTNNTTLDALYCKECENKRKKHLNKIKTADLEEGVFENENRTICPYCGYEYEEWEDLYEETGDEETECKKCDKTFIRTVEAKYTYTTKTLEYYEAE